MQHIQSISELQSYAVGKPAFWDALMEGQLLFPIGTEEISHAIDDATKSILSHVATVVKYRGQWCVFEAVWPHGVVITPICRYIDGGEDLILCKRIDPATGKDIDMTPALDDSVNYLGADYAAIGLLKEGLHLVCPSLLPAELNNNQSDYCSGVTQLINRKTSVPYPLQEGGAPTPEYLFIQPSTAVVATLRKGAQ